MDNQTKLREYLQTIPPYLTTNLGVIGQLDSKLKDSMLELEKLRQEHLPRLIYYDAKKKELAISQINQKFYECKSLGNKKTEIANQTYDLVDRYIRKLDSEMNILKELIDYYVSSDRKELQDVGSLSPFHYSMSQRDDKIKKRKLNESEIESSSEESDTDLSIDPNEPKYCICNDVSFGEMIACDNLDCSIEWFHMGCMRLNSHNKPKGKWYCPDCRNEHGPKKRKHH